VHLLGRHRDLPHDDVVRPDVEAIFGHAVEVKLQGAPHVVLGLFGRGAGGDAAPSTRSCTMDSSWRDSFRPMVLALADGVVAPDEHADLEMQAHTLRLKVSGAVSGKARKAGALCGPIVDCPTYFRMLGELGGGAKPSSA
jgi:hypothetical protein